MVKAQTSKITVKIDDVDTQLERTKVAKSRDEPIPQAQKYMFWCNNTFGRFPVVRLNDLVPGMVGGKNGNGYGKPPSRGFSLTRRATYDILSLRVGVPHDNDALRQFLVPMWRKAMKQLDPTYKSIQYQSMFPDLDDGTKVYNATQALQDFTMCGYAGIEDNDSKFQWEVPDRTFGTYLQNEDTNGSFWFLNLKFRKPQAGNPSPEVRFFDTSGSEFTEQRSEGAYNKGGVDLDDYDTMESLLDSNFYTKKRWSISLVVQIRGVTLRQGSRNGEPMIYPIFDIAPGNVVRFQEVLADGVEDTLPPEEARNLEAALVYEGMKGVGKKRKKPVDAKASGYNPGKKSKNVSKENKENEPPAETNDSE